MRAPLPLGAGLKVAASKGHIVASDLSVAKLICRDLRGRGVTSNATTSIRLLGADFASGAKPSRLTRAKRLCKVRGRTVKLRIARAAGVSTARFFKAADEPAALHATDIHGIPNTDLKTLRVTAGGPPPPGPRGGT